METAHCLCSDCYRKLNFITKPCCKICGRPFEYDTLGDLVCAPCLQKKPAYQMARSVLEYDDFSKKLILSFKHGDHTELVPLLTKFMLLADSDVFKDIDLIIPVPLHWTRLLKRKYNQSGLLGKSLSRKIGIPFHPNALVRGRPTNSQGHKSKKQRLLNIKNAFRVPKKSVVTGKNILLIDDVITTGATINECARVLKRNGVKTVKVLSLYKKII